MTLCPAKLDRDVAPLDVAGLGKTVTERADATGEGLRRLGAEIPDHGHRRLQLRARWERPGCRAAEKSHELPPPHPTLLRSDQSRTPPYPGLEGVARPVPYCGLCVPSLALCCTNQMIFASNP